MSSCMAWRELRPQSQGLTASNSAMPISQPNAGQDKAWGPGVLSTEPSNCSLSCVKLLLLFLPVPCLGQSRAASPLFPVPAASSFSPTGQGCWHCPALRAGHGIMNCPHMYPTADRTGHQHQHALVTLAVLPLAIPAACKQQPCRSSHAEQSMQHHGARPLPATDVSSGHGSMAGKKGGEQRQEHVPG